MAEHPVKLDELLSKYEYPPHEGSPTAIKFKIIYCEVVMPTHPVKLDEPLSTYEYAPHYGSPVDIAITFSLDTFRMCKFWLASDTYGRFVTVNRECANEWLKRTNPYDPSIDIALAE